MKLVTLDTNLWVSAIHFGNRPTTPVEAMDRASSHDRIVTCDEIDLEVLKTLTQKFGWAPDLAKDTVDALLLRAMRVKLQGLKMGCRDPKDDIVLECAVKANADLIVSGDKDLLVLGSIGHTRIVTPRQYLNEEY